MFHNSVMSNPKATGQVNINERLVEAPQPEKFKDEAVARALIRF